MSEDGPTTRGLTPFRLDDRVRYADVDARGHLNNVRFLELVEVARITYLRETWPDYDPTEASGCDLIVARVEIDYRSQAGFDDVITTEVEPADVQEKRFELRFTMRVGERVIAEARNVIVGFDYGAGESIPLAEDLRAGLDRSVSA